MLWPSRTLAYSHARNSLPWLRWGNMGDSVHEVGRPLLRNKVGFLMTLDEISPNSSIWIFATLSKAIS